MTAVWRVEPASAPAGRARFGIVIGRREMRRAVDRSFAKRAIRESARAAAASLDSTLHTRQLQLDVVFRFKARQPRALSVSHATLRSQLRAQADHLMGELEQHIMRLPAVAAPDA